MSSIKSDFYDIRLPHLSTKELRCQHLDSELIVNGIAAVECGIHTVVDQGSSKRQRKAVDLAFRYFCREFRNQVVPYDRKALSGPDQHRAYLWVDKHEYVWHHHKKVYPVIGACCFHLREYKGGPTTRSPWQMLHSGLGVVSPIRTPAWSFLQSGTLFPGEISETDCRRPRPSGNGRVS